MQPAKWAFPGGEKAHIGAEFPPKGQTNQGVPNWALGAHGGAGRPPSPWCGLGFSPTLPV